MPPNTDIATRALIVTLKSPPGGKTTAEISEITGISSRQVNRIYARAIERGFDPNHRPLTIRDEFLRDASRPGRPTKQTNKNQREILAKLSADGIEISAVSVRRILRKAGFRETKPTRKPGLTKKMRKERLQWCLDHKDWTLEDWKNVIWSDETSVILLHQRGSYRVWRKTDEALIRSCICERWKGVSEFMFWGAFSYDKTDPCRCWAPETVAEKKLADEAIKELKKELEPVMQEEWELSNGIRLGNGPQNQGMMQSRLGKLLGRNCPKIYYQGLG